MCLSLILHNNIATAQPAPWSTHYKRASHLDPCIQVQQSMFLLRQLKKLNLPQLVLIQLYTAITESILTLSITVWYNAPTKQDIQSLQRVIRSAEKITGCHKLQQT